LGRSSVLGSHVYVRPECRPGGTQGREAPCSMSARPLTRETSACAGWRHPLDGPQGSQGGRAPELPGFGVRRDGWGLNPVREVSSQPQRKLGRSRRPCSDRGSGGHVVVLVDCSGCRSRREASGPAASPRTGLATQLRARVVKGRRKPARGGKAARTVASSRRSRDLGPHGSRDRAERLGRSVSGPWRKPQARRDLERGRERSSREGVLVPVKRASLTRHSGKRAWRLPTEGSGRKAGALRGERRQRTSEAMPQARHAAENAAAGKRCAEELFRSGLRQDRMALRKRRCSGPKPRSKGAPVVVKPKLEVRRQAKLYPRVRPKSSMDGGSAELGATPAREWVRLCARESGNL
jgi:hypothetical protein